jgi:hypothetical protein
LAALAGCRRDVTILITGATDGQPRAVGAEIDRDFVYGTASENTFTVKAVDRAGNTSAASNAATDVC